MYLMLRYPSLRPVDALFVPGSRNPNMGCLQRLTCEVEAARGLFGNVSASYWRREVRVNKIATEQRRGCFAALASLLAASTMNVASVAPAHCILFFFRFVLLRTRSVPSETFIDGLVTRKHTVSPGMHGSKDA
ncbi:hypothetical protein V8C44DRAFT_319540 [Trichoderma aethiopicum]